MGDRMSAPHRVESLYPPGAGTPLELHGDAAAEALAWSFQVAQGGNLSFPWEPVYRIVGDLLPSWLVLVGGRGKGGKSTFLRECFNSWVTDFQKRVLYVGTEQSAGLLRLLWAALRCGAPAEAAIQPSHPMHGALLGDVETGQRALADRAMIVAEPTLTVQGFREWCRYAYRQKCDVVVLDHFHRIEMGDGEWQTRGEAVKALKNIAVKSNMLLVVAAQMKDGEGGMLGQYEVPGSNSWAETAALRRECDVALQVWRPFKVGVTREQKQAARDDMAKLADIVEPNVMAVRCDAHRYHDAAPYKAARLFVDGGQITTWTGRSRGSGPSA
jgi:hypothetical protein